MVVDIRRTTHPRITIVHLEPITQVLLERPWSAVMIGKFLLTINTGGDLSIPNKGGVIIGNTSVKYMTGTYKYGHIKSKIGNYRSEIRNI